MTEEVEDVLVRATEVSRHYSMGSAGGLFRRGGTDGPSVTALDSVSLSVHRGELLGIEGPSGSGKSSLLHVLAGLEQPDEGTVWFEGTPLSELTGRERRRHRLEQVGIVFQRFHLLDAYTARTNVALPLVELGWPKDRRRSRAEDLLESVGLADRIDHRPGQLSGGEQQRVAIARALVTEPALVIADEPTGELDSAAGKRVIDELQDIAKDRAVVVASHDRETIAATDRVVTLQDGTLAEADRDR